MTTTRVPQKVRHFTYVHPRRIKRCVITLAFTLVVSSVFMIIVSYHPEWLPTSTSLSNQTRMYHSKRMSTYIPIVNETKPSVQNVTSILPARKTETRDRYTRLPNCIIIGVSKAGTRALLTYLHMHPDITTAPQEAHYFDEDAHYNKGLSWYRKQIPFEVNKQVTIEKTANYFTNSKVPGRIYDLDPHMKLILVVRDPLYRSVSEYTHMRLWHQQQGMAMVYPDFEHLAFHGSETRNVSAVDNKYRALNKSIYFYHMQEWLKYFSLDQIHIVDGDNMVFNPYDEIHKVETFLRLEHKITKEHFYFDETKGFYCIQPDRKHAKCLNKAKGRKHPEIDEKVSKVLNAFFEPWNKKFFKLVGRTFRWPPEHYYIADKE